MESKSASFPALNSSVGLWKIVAFVHFRIRTFYLITRVENLNTLNISPFGFTANNRQVVGYADPGLIIHFGVAWGFIN